MKKWVYTLVLSVFNVSSLSFAQVPNRPVPGPVATEGMRHDLLLFDMLRQLGLSSEQSQRIDKVRAVYLGQERKLADALVSASEELGDLLSQEPMVKKERAREQQEKVLKLHATLSNLKFELKWDIAKLLTPSQRSKLKDMTFYRRRMASSSLAH